LQGNEKEEEEEEEEEKDQQLQSENAAVHQESAIQNAVTERLDKQEKDEKKKEQDEVGEEEKGEMGEDEIETVAVDAAAAKEELQTLARQIEMWEAALDDCVANDDYDRADEINQQIEHARARAEFLQAQLLRTPVKSQLKPADKTLHTFGWGAEGEDEQGEREEELETAEASERTSAFDSVWDDKEKSDKGEEQELTSPKPIGSGADTINDQQADETENTTQDEGAEPSEDSAFSFMRAGDMEEREDTLENMKPEYHDDDDDDDGALSQSQRQDDKEQKESELSSTEASQAEESHNHSAAELSSSFAFLCADEKEDQQREVEDSSLPPTRDDSPLQDENPAFSFMSS